MQHEENTVVQTTFALLVERLFTSITTKLSALLTSSVMGVSWAMDKLTTFDAWQIIGYILVVLIGSFIVLSPIISLINKVATEVNKERKSDEDLRPPQVKAMGISKEQWKTFQQQQYLASLMNGNAPQSNLYGGQPSAYVQPMGAKPKSLIDQLSELGINQEDLLKLMSSKKAGL